MERYKVFIDTNIPIYASGRNHPNKNLSLKILEDISKNRIFGITSVEVFQELLYRFHSLNMFNKGIEVFEGFYNIVDEVLPVNFQIVKNARLIMEKNSEINTRDAIHAATINYYNIPYIATFDKHFNIFKNIKNYLYSK